MKKFTVDLANIPLYYPGAVKPVKRSFKGKTPKAAKAKTSTAKSAKPKKAPRTKAAKVSKVKTTKTTKAPKAKKAPSRTREQIAAEAAAKRQARFEAFQERQAQKQLKEYEAYLSETEKYAREMQRDIDRAEREYRKAVREFNKEERQKKLRQITENKMRSQGYDPSNYRENLISMISNKAGEFGNTSQEHKEELGELLGVDPRAFDLTLKDRKNFVYRAITDYNDFTDEELTEKLRKLETFDRKERLHVRGIEESMDEETAKKIMFDILSSDKVSNETKAVLRLLGPKGALLYTNYRQIQFQKFGANFKEAFYSQAAATFWDTSTGDKVALKKHGYNFSKKNANFIKDSSVGLSTNIDAEAFTKFAIEKMNLDEATAFTQQLEGLEGFGKNLRVTYYNGKRVVR